MNTTESNKLIAEFMGVKPTSTKHTKYWYDGWELSKAGLPFAYGAHGNGTDEPKFNTSWDWLIPVIDKIGEATEEPEVLDGYTYIMVYGGQIRVSTEIEGVYNDVIDIIERYNQNK